MKFIAILAISSSLISSIYGELAPLKVGKNVIPDQYIVNLKKNTRTTLDAHVDTVQKLFTDRSDNNKIHAVYRHLGKIYSAKFSKDVLEKVRNLPDVDFIEADAKVSLKAVQSNAPWGLARISQRQFVNKSTYNYNADGTGVTVYVVDTGVLVSHPEFGGRAVWGANFVSGSSNSDENGHGTHCAGTVGSRTYGVSKNVNIVAVKVLDGSGSGSWSGIISGINWAAGDQRGQRGNVISLSIGGDYIASANNAVDAATANGVVVVVAAGNENTDACTKSPASAAGAFTVAASDINDRKASFSNYGQCVDIIAPGVNVLSTWNNGGTNTISGTSMATPHVAGLAAYYLSKGSYTVDQLKQLLRTSSTKNAVYGFSADTKNYLAYNSIA